MAEPFHRRGGTAASRVGWRRWVDLTKFRSIVIWCEITNNAYSAAAL